PDLVAAAGAPDVAVELGEPQRVREVGVGVVGPPGVGGDGVGEAGDGQRGAQDEGALGEFVGPAVECDDPGRRAPDEGGAGAVAGEVGGVEVAALGVGDHADVPGV